MFYLSGSTVRRTLVCFYSFSLTGSLFLFVLFVESASRMENARCQKNGLNSRSNCNHPQIMFKLWMCILEYLNFDPYLLCI